MPSHAKPEREPRAEPDGAPSRLVRAVEAYFRHVDAGGDRDDLLREHEDLIDLLEPMLRAGDAEAEQPQRTVGEFRLLRELGRGGMGVVHEALQLSLGRRVAIKLLPEHLCLDAPSFARLKLEALNLAKLDHPGIVKVLAVGEQDGAPWFAMELVHGRSLDSLLAELRSQRRVGAEHFKRMAGLAAEVAEALSHAHEAGVVHRDVKPSNVLVTDAGHAVLTDFGMARDLELSGVSLGGGGTPHYMSPEQVEGRPADARSDVFSLGVALYEMLTLRRPFEGETREAVQREIARRDPIDPKRLAPELPPPLAAIVLHALAKEPERRYASAKAFAEDLRAFLSDRPVRARREGPLGRLRRWARREPAKAALAVTLALFIPALAATMGYLYARWPQLRAGERREIEQWLDEGFMAVSSSDRDQDRAFATFRRVLDRDPDNLEGIVGLVFAEDRWGTWDAALAILDKHRGNGADKSVLAHMRAFIYKRSGRVEEGRQLAASLPPPTDGLEVYVDALVRRSLAPPDDLAGDRQFRKDLSLAARLTPRPHAGIYFGLAYASIKCGTEGERDELAETITRLWPNSPNAFKVAGQTWEGIDDAKAERAYRRAIAIWPGFFNARGELGRMLLARGDVANALRELRQAAKDARGGEPWIIKLLAETLERSGDPEGARLERERIAEQVSTRRSGARR